MFTEFFDMHSGGGCKEAPYEYIVIEAAQLEATIIFYNRFGHNPHRISCTCCGNDYYVSEHKEDIVSATKYHREDAIFKRPKDPSLSAFLSQDNVLVICAEDIKPEDRLGTVPEEGYV